MSDHGLPRLLMKPQEAATRLGISTLTLRRGVANGTYPAPVRFGPRSPRWRVAEIEAYLAAPPKPVPQRRPKSVPLGPDVQHLYRHYDRDGRLLYVGISLSAVARLADHKKESHWFWQIARIEVTAYATRASAMKAERISIQREKPLHNIVHAVRKAA